MRPTTDPSSKNRTQASAHSPDAIRAAGRTGCVAVVAAMLLAGSPAAAQDVNFTLHVEPGVAFWVDAPQTDRFTPGFYAAVRPGISLGRIVALQWSYALLWTPANGTYGQDGSGHFFMGGVRVRPLATLMPPSEQLGGLFVDANLGYVRTGPLDRFGFDIGIGYGFQVASWLSLGPVLRYVQIVQPDNTPNEDPNDAQLLVLGLDMAFGPAPSVDEPLECPVAPECAARAVLASSAEPVPCAESTACADGDRDGVCDADDRCPAQIGPPATLGCPIEPCSGAPLLVLVQFAFDSAELPAPRDDEPQTMDPVLDAVAAAIMRETECRVCIVGHASEEGDATYNTELSARRAAAVQDYMTARGLSESRMPTTGLGTMCQLVPESTRLLNRRVEFRRLAEGESCPTDCLE